MKESYLKAFNAIVNFVNDLWEVFGNPKKPTPLALYRRLTQHIKFTDEKAILKAIRPFKKFVTKNKEIIMSGELAKMHRGTVIPYGTRPRICIEIQKFIHKGDTETNAIIHQHLLTISAIFSPNEKTIQELEKKLNENSPESKMIKNVIDKIGPVMAGIDTQNPMAAITQLASSGIMGELFGSMTQGLQSGEMDFGRLLGSLQSTLGPLAQGGATIEEIQEVEEVEEVEDTRPTVDKPKADGETPAVDELD